MLLVPKQYLMKAHLPLPEVPADWKSADWKPSFIFSFATKGNLNSVGTTFQSGATTKFLSKALPSPEDQDDWKPI